MDFKVDIPCLLQDTRHIYWLLLPKQWTRKKLTMKNKNPLPANHILRLGLCTKNPWLREVDLDPSPKRGSGKINIHKQGRNNQKESNWYQTAWTQIWIPALREVNLQPSAKGGANGTRALVRVYWLSWSLHLKQSPNQISHKSTKLDPIR